MWRRGRYAVIMRITFHVCAEHLHDWREKMLKRKLEIQTAQSDVLVKYGAWDSDRARLELSIEYAITSKHTVTQSVTAG